MINEYIAYLKDNPEGYWFKAKLYGWGWTPATWQGWLVLVVYVTLIVADFARIEATSQSENDTLFIFLPRMALFTILLVYISYKKGEKPRWQWGLPKNKNDTQV